MRFLAHGSHVSHGFCLRHFEHEIFLHEIFLNTNNPNNTNIFWHTDLTLTDSLLLMFEHESYE